MGLLVSGIVAEIFLQYREILTIKSWIETDEIIYYSRYVDIFHKNNQRGNNNYVHEHNTPKLGIQANRRRQW
jgi:hypothetical protein